MMNTANPARTKNIIKLVATTSVMQAAVQLMGIVCGIAIIRILPIQEYAYYTIANTVLGTMGLLSDSGINNGMMAHGGPVYQDKQELGKVLSTGISLRHRFALLNLIISVPVLAILLLRQGASPLMIVTITAALVPAYLAALNDSILEIPLKLHQNLGFLQRNQLVVGLGRLGLTALLLLVMPWSFAALIGNGFPRMLGNYKLKQHVSHWADLDQPSDKAINGQLIKIIRRVFPLTLYYAYSSQIVVWLASLSDSPLAVAQIGAVSRISMLVTLFSTLFAILVIPRYARLNADRRLLSARFGQILAALTLLALILVLGCHLTASYILMLLGSTYKGLESALVLIVAASVINLVSGAIYGLYSSRGWTIRPVLSIGVNLLAICIGLAWFNISNLEGLLLFNLSCAFAQLLVNLVFCIVSIARSPQNHYAI